MLLKSPYCPQVLCKEWANPQMNITSYSQLCPKIVVEERLCPVALHSLFPCQKYP